MADRDHGAFEAEVVELTRALLRVDSTNGNETAVAEVLAAYLGTAGVAVELAGPDPARQNLIARLPGSGNGPSLAFVGHSDVVPADARDWTHPPFAAVLDDAGYLWGRGALDMKNEVAARAVALVSLAREGFVPGGDLLLIIASDEEDGSAGVGMNWLTPEPAGPRGGLRPQRGRRAAVPPRRRPAHGRVRHRREGHVPGPGRRSR